ncbi:MAG: hypothetical protein L3J97_06175, partial [Thermoplasmata archaeon]|nr:hypothetical protein [Thermoplasmata archaeon]
MDPSTPSALGSGRWTIVGRLLLATAVVAVLGLLVLGASAPSRGGLIGSARSTPGALGPHLATASTAPPAAISYTPLLLSVGAVPHTICVQDSALCSAQTGETQVTLTAAAPNTGLATWPSVQVAIVVETAVYDGVYDPPTSFDPGTDKCADVSPASSPACEESNGVPFFVAHAQQIANAIAAANPHSNVSFAMVDYFA